MKADLNFGVEPVQVGDAVQMLDICALADVLYTAMKQLPDVETEAEVIKAEAGVLNDVLKANGLPAIQSTAAAYKFAQEILARAIELGKACRSVWTSADEPALPHDYQD